MNYLTVFALGLVLGLAVDFIAPFYFWKRDRREVRIETEDSDLKEEVEWLKKELDALKMAQKEEDAILKAEKEFFENPVDN